LTDQKNGQREHNIRNWAAILGRWHFDEGGGAIYDAPANHEFPFGVCVSDVRFVEGEARVSVRQPDGEIDARILLGYRSLTDEYFAVGLGGYGCAYTLTHFIPGLGWRLLAGAGNMANLTIGQSHEILVRVRGQRVMLEVNRVRVFEHVLPRPIPFGQLGLFAWGNGGVEFSGIFVKEDRGRGDVFVVMQFHGFEELYTDVIVPVTEEFGLQPYRADEVYGPGNILADIVFGIQTAQIVIAEITPPNENVFYEVGYAHALQKPTILLANKTKSLPFDLTGYRCLFYENSIGGKRKIEEGLRKHLQAILHE
jgi:hypothetical protein